MQALESTCIWKYGYVFSGADVWLNVLLTIALAACLALASLAPRQYVRCRPVTMSALRILCFTAFQRPHRDVTLVSLAAADPWRQGVGVLSTLHFLTLLTFATGAAPAALWAYASPLPLPLHVVVQCMTIARLFTAILPICASTVMQQAPSASIVRKLCYFLDVLAWPFPWGQGLRASDWPGPEEECWAVILALLVVFGHIIPTLVLALWEYHEFLGFRRLARGGFVPCWCTCTYQSLAGGAGDVGWAGYIALFMAGWLLFIFVWDTLVLAAWT
jgi:hypothetical protein